METPVLVVDLDGTLLSGDTLVEQALWLLGRRPWDLVRVFAAWLRKPSRVSLKRLLAGATSDLPVDRLPMRGFILERIREARKAGARTVLATASHRMVAIQIAEHVGLFTDVLATEERNLKGSAKLDAIRALLGSEPFAYMGNGVADLPIWREAAHAIVVARPHTARWLTRQLPQAEVIRSPGASVRDWLGAVRVHQWSKNLLVLLPVVAAHQWSDITTITAATVTLIAASLLASSMYLANDLLDVHADRMQASARRRPIAEGVIQFRQASYAIVALLAAPFILIRLTVPTRATALMALLCGYVVLNVAYNLRLKRVIMLDVMLLSLMYLWRITLGAVATGIWLSDWLLAFSVFFFLGLASAKRCIELGHTQLNEATPGLRSTLPVFGRGYRSGDLAVMRSLGIGCGLLSVLVLALYLKDPSTAALYQQPQMLWGVALLLLYWVGRLWVRVSRNEVDADPVQFAIRDSATYLTAAAMAVCLLAAIA